MYGHGPEVAAALARSMSALPLAPLTLAELNKRTARAASDLAWFTASCYRADDEPTGALVAEIRRLVTRLFEAQTAAEARL